MPPLSGLALQGIPLELLSSVSESDAASPLYATARAAFEAARAEGTSLLPLALEPGSDLPEHLLFAVLDAVLGRFTGVGPDLTTEDTRRAHLEAILTLLEAVSSDAGRDLAPPPVPASPPSPSRAGTRFVVARRPLPPWLAHGAAQSRTRAWTATRIPVQFSQSSLSDPAQRAAEESRTWLGTPPLGATATARGIVHAEGLAEAADGRTLTAEETATPSQPRRMVDRDEVAWLPPALQGLAHGASAGVHGPAQPPPSVREAALARLVLPPESPEGWETTVLTPETISVVLPTFDVMAEYREVPVL